MSQGEDSTTGLRVGVIGLGTMGRPTAAHPLAAGLAVHVLDPDTDAVEHCTTQGTTEAARPAALSAADGVLAGAGPGTAVLLCSSLRPQTCQQEAAAATPGVSVLDGGDQPASSMAKPVAISSAAGARTPS